MGCYSNPHMIVSCCMIDSKLSMYPCRLGPWNRWLQAHQDRQRPVWVKLVAFMYCANRFMILHLSPGLVVDKSSSFGTEFLFDTGG